MPSLLDIEGEIGTGVDKGACISTSYLIGEIVVIPLTSYFSRVFSFRIYLLVSTFFFALFSMGSCALDRNVTIACFQADCRATGLSQRIRTFG